MLYASDWETVATEVDDLEVLRAVSVVATDVCEMADTVGLLFEVVEVEARLPVETVEEPLRVD